MREEYKAADKVAGGMSAKAFNVYVECAVMDSEASGEVVESYTTSAEAVDEIRRVWNEDEEGPQVYLVRTNAGKVLAVLTRDADDAEICHTLYCDGTVEHHRCHYLIADDGYYGGTVVTPLAKVDADGTPDWVDSDEPEYLLREGCRLNEAKDAVTVDAEHRIVSRFAN